LLNSQLFFALAQSEEEIDLLKNIFESHVQKQDYNFVEESDNSTEFVFTQLFKFYKLFISSQDNKSCGFHPSCSVYAIQSIHHQGSLVGIINAFDRLTRCNGLSPEHYILKEELHLLEDDVRNIKYEYVK
jgi:hypothetical protein